MTFLPDRSVPLVVSGAGQRGANATRGAFKVADFERMLLSVHGAVVGGDPNCNMDAWADNHYAVDATHDYDFVHAWLRANPSQPYVCQGEYVHFVFDPTGWAVQLNVNFTEPGPSCDARSDDGWTCYRGTCKGTVAADDTPSRSRGAGSLTLLDMPAWTANPNRRFQLLLGLGLCASAGAVGWFRLKGKRHYRAVP